eukprot:TRINITY_DN2010_c0_g3_i1.p1 TRINITY_DN2010_c0_g3~~TRINITY_DN2010_c0_g3_i1.p1  ORF type:complete len:868 (-),score=169.36 TRINITY_DN2010_c0_g3_i1:251-2854(-)
MMINFERLKELFDWDRRSLVKRKGRISTFDVIRKYRAPNDAPRAKMTIIEGLHFNPKNVQGLVNSLQDAISPFLSVIRGQSDLLTEVEVWALKESSIQRAPNTMLIDLIVVERYFKEDLDTILEESKVNANAIEMEKLIAFLIRMLRMVEQRSLVIPNLTPSSIVFEGESGFRLRGILGGICSIYDTERITEIDQTYCTEPISIQANEQEFFQTIDDWRTNERFCAGMILLQVANHWNREQLTKFRKEYMTQNIELNDLFPDIPSGLLNLITMLLEGAPLADMANAHESDSQDRVGISTEDFSITRGVGRDLAQTLKAKNEMSHMVSDLKAELERMKSSHVKELIELNTKLQKEAEEEKRKLEQRIGELNANLKRDEDLISNLKDIVKKECNTQTAQIVKEVTQKTSDLVFKLQSDHSTTLNKIGQDTEVIKQNIAQAKSVIVDKLCEEAVLGREVVKKECNSQAAQIVKEMTQKISEVAWSLKSDQITELTKINQITETIKQNIAQTTKVIIEKLCEEGVLGRELVKKECNSQAAQIVKEITQKTSDLVSKLQSDHSTKLTKIGQDTEMIKQNVAQAKNVIVDKLCEEAVLGRELVKKECNSQAAQIVNEMTQKVSDLVSKLQSDHLTKLTKLGQDTDGMQQKVDNIAQITKMILDKLSEKADLVRKVETSVNPTNKAAQDKFSDRFTTIPRAIEKKQGLPPSWPLKEFEFGPMALNDNLGQIEAKIPEMNTPSTRTKFYGNWRFWHAGDINPKMLKVVDILNKVTNLSHLSLPLTETTLNDDGCAAIANILRASKHLTHLEVRFMRTKVSDIGVSYLTPEILSLPLQYLDFSVRETIVTDKGVINLVDVLKFLPNLSYLELYVIG